VVREDLLCHYDIFPTLLDTAGLENPDADTLPGTSFAPLLRGAASLDRPPVVVYDEYGHTRMIRTHRSKYVHRPGGEACEFYDLADDPGETENRIDVAACRDEIEHLRAQLEGWFDRYVDPDLDGFKHPVTGCGQYDLAGKPGAFAQDWPEEWKPKA
jgi:arylsulfatase A-like enzyme